MPNRSYVEQFFAVAEASMSLRFRDLENDLPHRGEKGA